MMNFICYQFSHCFLFQVNVEFEVDYVTPNESPNWSGSVLESLDDDQQKLIDIEQNIANLERNMALDKKECEIEKKKSLSRGNFLTRGFEKSPAHERKG